MFSIFLTLEGCKPMLTHSSRVVYTYLPLTPGSYQIQLSSLAIDLSSSSPPFITIPNFILTNILSSRFCSGLTLSVTHSRCSGFPAEYQFMSPCTVINPLRDSHCYKLLRLATVRFLNLLNPVRT